MIKVVRNTVYQIQKRDLMVTALQQDSLQLYK